MFGAKADAIRLSAGLFDALSPFQQTRTHGNPACLNLEDKNEFQGDSRVTLWNGRSLSGCIE